ncbi:hypothetical protein RCL1_000665 [Eukaryota sp. TZLM3-RCL]
MGILEFLGVDKVVKDADRFISNASRNLRILQHRANFTNLTITRVLRDGKLGVDFHGVPVDSTIYNFELPPNLAPTSVMIIYDVNRKVFRPSSLNERGPCQHAHCTITALPKILQLADMRGHIHYATHHCPVCAQYFFSVPVISPNVPQATIAQSNIPVYNY